MITLNAIQQRRLRNFKANKRGYYSLIIFMVLFGISLIAEFVANDKPLLVKYQGEYYMPVFQSYPETHFGGEFETEADYTDEFVQDLITTNGDEEISEGEEEGWMIWPLIPYSHDTIVYNIDNAPSPPSTQNFLGTDDTARDVAARVIYGFRLTVLFAMIVTIITTILGIVAGAIQGYFGGWVDLLFQRFVEIWSNTPQLYIIMIIAAVIGPTFWVLVGIVCTFGWTALVSVVRAEFLRARNFEYVQAARALGVSDSSIMFRHVLPNAMVATVTMLPFIITSYVSTLAGLDLLGFGLQSNYPSLGELALQGKNNVSSYWLGLAAFFTLAIMLSLLVFIFEAVRDAFDPRKTFG